LCSSKNHRYVVSLVNNTDVIKTSVYMRFQDYFFSTYCESYINYLKSCPVLDEEVFQVMKGQFFSEFTSIWSRLASKNRRVKTLTVWS